MQDDNKKTQEEEKTEDLVENTVPDPVEEQANVELEEAPAMQDVLEEAKTQEKAAQEILAEEKPAQESAPEEKVEELEASEKTEEIKATEEDGQPAPEEVKVQEAKPHSPSDLGKWYIIHTYSGHENKVAKSLKQRVETMGFDTRIFDIIVPTRNTIKVSQGKKENVKEKIFPGYVLVKMILDDESWLLVRTTQGVTAFIGAGNKPTPISEKEVDAIQKFMQAEEPMFTTTFTVGEAVKIVDGPFADFLGTVDNIDEAKGKLKVLVSIFGRETPVELDFLQVSKL